MAIDRNKMEFADEFGSPSRKAKVDTYWDGLANHKETSVVIQSLAHMPLRHLRTVVNNTSHDMFARQLAASTYRNKKAAGYPE